MISKTLFRLIDGLILCANKLCGIDTINFNGEESDFLTYLIFSDEIGFAFKISALIATILLVVFSVFMIVRTMAKDKAEGTPAQIGVKAFKTILMFFLVPALVVAFMMLGNAVVQALYSATAQGAATPGTFLFCAFAEDGGMRAEYVALFKSGELDYTVTSEVAEYMNLANYPFLFSWLAGGVVLFGLASAMLTFVDRVISLVILYIASPVSISTSVLDDGARFKLWRDQFLSKFIIGYGMILAINIYALVCGLVMAPGFAFFPGTEPSAKFLDLVLKLLIFAGGALNLQKSMALVGNLVSAGAGSNELRDSMSAGSIAKMAGGALTGVAGKALGVAGGVLGLPFKPLKDNIKDAYSLWSRNKAEKWLNGKKDGKDGEGKGAKNDKKAKYGSDEKTKRAIKNGGFKQSFDGKGKGKDGDNTNNNSPKKNEDNAVNKAIEGGGQNQTDQNNQNEQQGNDNQQEGDNA